ncbi:MAG: transmembrane anchor protein [Phycisphaerae bacterium]|nr:transmembrane anchor protein [Phycisphaerae bacterium]MBM92285.1 transmembrane anchor protein [Phycisphaerae bacterium]|tara:strand:- start:194 stop:796 length:603 start_codon:yes stop_codon:yes gene_type:complete
MHNANIPDYTELPSNKRLFKSTIIAIVSAAIILVTIVLPAEFGIDPTGVGSLSGLKRMGEIKTALAEELKADQQNQSSTTDTTPITNPVINQTDAAPRTDTMSVTIDANKSTEIKLTMRKGATVEFTWSTDAGPSFYDLHGDSKEINYHIYEKGTETSKQGTLVASFDGNHGWYWKNRSAAPITITLKTNGDYQDIKEMN